jgi:hypothetical protein
LRDIAVRFTVGQMMLVIGVLGVVLAILVQVPLLVVEVGDGILLGFAVYKVAHTPRPLRLILVIAIALVVLGVCIGFWFPIRSH